MLGKKKIRIFVIAAYMIQILLTVEKENKEKKTYLKDEDRELGEKMKEISTLLELQKKKTEISI